MDHGKKKYSASRAPAKKGTPLGLIVVLALAGGSVLGWAGTYFYFRPLLAAKQSAPSVGSATSPVQITMPNQGGYTPAPQPPGEAPPGKVWSVEHGHWHDIPVTLTSPEVAPAAVTPAAATTPAPEAVPAPGTVPAPGAVPAPGTAPAPGTVPKE